MYFIGIDLAWTYKNKTGVTIFEERTCILSEAEVFSDEMLVEIVKKYSPCIVSIDAPLVVKNEKGGRSVDSLLMQTKIHKRYLKLYATSRSYMLRVFGAIRGERLLRLSKLELGKTIFETYPTGIFLSLFPDIYDQKYKISSRKSLRQLIENSEQLIERIKKLGFKFELSMDSQSKTGYKSREDQLDSVLCAINSFYCYQDKARIFSDDSGLISLPNFDKVL